MVGLKSLGVGNITQEHMSANPLALQLWMVIDMAKDGKRPDLVTLDVSRCAGNFPLNDRPRLTATIALGRRADDVNVASSIHLVFDKLRMKQKAKVWLKVQMLGFPNEPGDFPAFP